MSRLKILKEIRELLPESCTVLTFKRLSGLKIFTNAVFPCVHENLNLSAQEIQNQASVKSFETWFFPVSWLFDMLN